MAVWARFYFATSWKETLWSKGVSQSDTGRLKVGCFIWVCVFKHLPRGCSKSWEDGPYHSFTGRCKVVCSEDSWPLKQPPQLRRKTPSETAPLTVLTVLKPTDQWQESKDRNRSPQKGSFQNYSPYRMWNNLNLRQTMTARLPSRARQLPQTPWRLARLTKCHHMTPPKKKSTCLSRGSLRKKYFLAVIQLVAGVCILALRRRD